MSDSDIYNENFYINQASYSLRSGVATLSILFDLIGKPKSVLDVGCGTGSWLAAAHNHGVGDIFGVDGGSSAKDMLMIPPSCFRELDVCKSFTLSKKYDLIISLEVAEHLNVESHTSFIQNLSAHGDVVLFSAAIPYQGGTGHRTENWPAYWCKLFSSFGYDCYDVIRPLIWDLPGIEFWYKQNIFLFIKSETAASLGLVDAQRTQNPLALVHPEMYLWSLRRSEELTEQQYHFDRKYYFDLKDGKDTAFISVPEYGSKFNNEF
ncbi:class I SAM-dependent methyltransferase [Alishewanella jeotgali]|uniref:Methyltransferase domain-containing protein n=1 Tax=Alishewanella jeotgali KCTC 22429 TaxID=1129374 RepID=H3ZBJ6_9ALTE|nr:class I SAM-dependent methyltransferase [Alishewanella jeotgali]EHR42310.1 hypothetical protein AJE_03506 [Alishewanella jeotgali KCTC 22429]